MSRSLAIGAVLAAAALTGAVAGAQPLPPVPAATRCDLDGQEGIDVVVRHHYTHLMPHEGWHEGWGLTGGAAQRGVATQASVSPFHIIAVGDFEVGGTCEVLWQSGDATAGPTKLAVTPFRLPTLQDFELGHPSPGSAWRLVGTEDLSQDGATDLLWWHQGLGRLQAWLRVPGGGWDKVPVFGGPINSLSLGYPVAAARLERGGHPGVLWLEPTLGSSAAIWYYRTGTGPTAVQLDEGKLLVDVEQPEHRIVAVGDFDQDGWDDLLWQHAGTQRLRVCFLEGAQLRECMPLDPEVFEDSGINHEEYHWTVVGPR